MSLALTSYLAIIVKSASAWNIKSKSTTNSFEMPVLVNNSWDLLTPFDVKTGKDEGGKGLGPKDEYTDCVVAEYVWVDAAGVPRSKTKTLSKKPYDVDCLPVSGTTC